MLATGKVFTTGNSQAVRLPKAFRVDAAEMWISKNEITGDITLRPMESEDQRQRNLKELFRLIAETHALTTFFPSVRSARRAIRLRTGQNLCLYKTRRAPSREAVFA